MMAMGNDMTAIARNCNLKADWVESDPNRVIPFPGAREKPRVCLMCCHTFLSEGAHNRICRRCKNTRVWRDGALYATALAS